ncbi:hypothetical protein COP1_026188 [Malus domestica]
MFIQQQIFPRQVIATISHSVTTFNEARAPLTTTPVPSSHSTNIDVQWSPLSPGFVKIHVDASWVASEGLGFTGVVVRDEDGRFLAAYRYCVKATSVAMVEVMAIMHGCKLGICRGWNSVIVESDSLESISCLSDMAMKGIWDAFPIIVKCNRLGGAFHDCHWSWVPRLANSVVDLLASRRSREVCDHIWVDRPPSSLVHVLCNDGLPYPLDVYGSVRRDALALDVASWFFCTSLYYSFLVVVCECLPHGRPYCKTLTSLPG